jgi:hypothetical protein
MEGRTPDRDQGEYRPPLEYVVRVNRVVARSAGFGLTQKEIRLAIPGSIWSRYSADRLCRSHLLQPPPLPSQESRPNPWAPPGLAQHNQQVRWSWFRGSQGHATADAGGLTDQVFRSALGTRKSAWESTSADGYGCSPGSRGHHIPRRPNPRSESPVPPARRPVTRCQLRQFHSSGVRGTKPGLVIYSVPRG